MRKKWKTILALDSQLVTSSSSIIYSTEIGQHFSLGENPGKPGGLGLVQKMWRREKHGFPPRCSCFRSVLWKESKMGAFGLTTDTVAVRGKVWVRWEDFGSQMPEKAACSRVIYISPCYCPMSLDREGPEISLPVPMPHDPVADSHTSLWSWWTAFGICEFWHLPSSLITWARAHYLTFLCVSVKQRLPQSVITNFGLDKGHGYIARTHIPPLLFVCD